MSDLQSATIRRLELPISAEEVRSLQVGDMVTLHGTVVLCAGLPTHARLAEHVRTGTEPPFDLRGAALLHLGSYSRETERGFEVLYLNPTTSTRFNDYIPTLVPAFGLRILGGKGGLDENCTRALQKAGAVYLSFLGGGCTLLSQAIREVVAAEWNDLIHQYRLVKLRVDGLGPATVGIDAHGHSLYDSLQANAEARLPEILAELKR